MNRPELFHPDPATHAVIRQEGIERLLELLRVVDGKLEGKTWAAGERFTIADAYLGVFWRWVYRGRRELLEQLPNLSAFGARFDQRPSVQAAIVAEQASSQRQAAA